MVKRDWTEIGMKKLYDAKYGNVDCLQKPPGYFVSQMKMNDSS